MYGQCADETGLSPKLDQWSRTPREAYASIRFNNKLGMSSNSAQKTRLPALCHFQLPPFQKAKKRRRSSMCDVHGFNVWLQNRTFVIRSFAAECSFVPKRNICCSPIQSRFRSPQYPYSHLTQIILRYNSVQSQMTPAHSTVGCL